MLASLSLLITAFLSTTALADPSGAAAVLAKCKTFEKMPLAQQQQIANQAHTTVKTILTECSEAEHPSEAGRLAACRRYQQMAPAELAQVAKESNTTPAAIRHACYVIEHPSDGEPSQSGGQIAPPAADPSECSCGATQVCARQGGGYTCLDPSSTGNRCSVSSDCGQNPVRGLSNCIGGQCT